MRSQRPDLGPLHPFNDAIVGIYLAGKEQAMHRRAQKAEAELRRLWLQLTAEIEHLEARLRRATNRERNQRRRATRLHRWADVAAHELRENARLRAERDPLRRIIDLGKRFP